MLCEEDHVMVALCGAVEVNRVDHSVASGFPVVLPRNAYQVLLRIISNCGENNERLAQQIKCEAVRLFFFFSMRDAYSVSIALSVSSIHDVSDELARMSAPISAFTTKLRVESLISEATTHCLHAFYRGITGGMPLSGDPTEERLPYRNLMCSW